MSDPEHTLLSEGLADDPFAGTAYRTVRPIGEGGMGVVLEVEHLALGKRLVAKVLKPHLVDDPNLTDRFRFEAQALAQLSHPNLVPVLDLGRTRDGRPFFVMEKLTGRTLGEELRARGVLPAAEAVEITLQVLAGLSAAHAHGLVHRDVKLDNVFLCDARPTAGTRARDAGHRAVKVLDFGVAKASRTGPILAAPPSHPTAEGTVMGTPRYVAPEQIRGVGVDARADVYTTGMLLYTLLAGRSPFAGLTGLELLQAHLTRPPEPLSNRCGARVSPALDAAVLRALAKSPDDRYPSAADFADDLLRILEALPPGEPSRPSLTALGTQRIVAVPDVERLRAAHAARTCEGERTGAGRGGGADVGGGGGRSGGADRGDGGGQTPGPGGAPEEEAPEEGGARAAGEALAGGAPRGSDLVVFLAVLATSAVVFWMLFVAGARLIGWR